MITSIIYLNDGWTLINKCVKIQIDIKNEKIHSLYNKNVINEKDSLILIDEFIQNKISELEILK
jgi:hypothetical protein